MSYEIKIKKIDGTKLATVIQVTPFSSDDNAIRLFDSIMNNPKPTWKRVTLHHHAKGKSKVLKAWPKDYSANGDI